MRFTDPYTREELDKLIDWIIMFQLPDDDGFNRYAIRGVYVSPEVIDQALLERLEKIHSLQSLG